MAQFLRNQGISVTERGTLRVLPALPSTDLDDFTVLLLPVLLMVFSATFLPAAVALDAAFLAVPLVLAAAFLAAPLVLAAAFLAVFLALTIAFLATGFFAAGFFAAAFLAGDFFETAAISFFEIKALSPALTNPFCPAFAILAEDLIPASLSFFAVALPIPGNAIRVARGSFFDLPAMSSPNVAMTPLRDEPFSQLGV